MRRHDHPYTERCDHCSAAWPDWAVQFAITMEEDMTALTDALTGALTSLAEAVDAAAGRVAAHVADTDSDAAEVAAAVDKIKAATDKLTQIVPAPAAAPAAPASPAAAPERTEYVVDPGVAVDATEWPASGSTAADGRTLYHYAGDTAPGDAKGDGLGGVWHVYHDPAAAPAA